ncbi:MAG: integration host factor subunit alpha [Magnetococcales bacterium]|nr:integration host factor subunit alpha [Magnetococcales bacterium]
MTKSDIVETLHKKTGVPRRNAMQIVETFFEIIREQLEQHEEVKLAGFGNFSTRKKGSRLGRNPRTMQEVEISQRDVVSFHPSHILRAKVDPHHGTTHDDAPA